MSLEVPFIIAEAPLIIATSESRGLPNLAGGRQQRGTRGAEVLLVRCPGNRESTRGADFPPVRCFFQVEPMKRGVKLPGCPGGCLSAVCFLGCPVGGLGAWCCCPSLLSGLVVWPFFSFRPPGLFLSSFLK